jgi:cytochrome c-type biogenesis protein CcmH
VTEFTVLALLLSMVAALFVVWPAASAGREQVSVRRQTNISAYQSRLEELAADFAAGEYSESEYQRLTVELQRRLLEEEGADNSVKQLGGGRWLCWLLAAMIPLMALGLYQQIGAERDVQLAELIEDLQGKARAGEDNQVELQRLADHLRQALLAQPDHHDYLMMLGRSEMELGEYGRAATTMARLSQLRPDDAEAAAYQVQALYLAHNQQLLAPVQKAVEKALALDPQQPVVLGLLGIHHYHRGELPEALEYWQRLLVVLDPEDPNSMMIAGAVQELQKKLGVVEAVVSVKVKVALAEGFSPAADLPVFVFARAIGGPKMPLAVARMTVADLPAEVILDDSLAMSPAMKLSSFDKVEVVARVAKGGIANPSSGDLQGQIASLEVKLDPDVAGLLIDRILP